MKRVPILLTTVYLSLVATAILQGFLSWSNQPHAGHSFLEAGWLTGPWTWLTFDFAGAQAPNTATGLAIVVAIFALLNSFLVHCIGHGLLRLGKFFVFNRRHAAVQC